MQYINKEQKEERKRKCDKIFAELEYGQNQSAKIQKKEEVTTTIVKKQKKWWCPCSRVTWDD